MSFRIGVLVLGLVWGTQFIVIKVGQETLPPLLTVAARYLVVLLLVQAFLVVKPVTLAARRVAGRLVYGIAQGVSMALMYLGTGQLPSSVAALVLGVTPFAVLVAAHFAVRNERLDLRALIATTSGFAGLVVLITSTRSVTSSDVITIPALGLALMLGVVVTDTITKISAKRLIADIPTPVLLRDMSIAAAVVGLAGHFLFERNAPVVFSGRSVAAFLYLGVVGSALASGLYLELLKKHAVGGLAYLQFLTTLVAVLCGALVAGERLPQAVWLGAGLVLLGLLVRSRMVARGN